MASHEMKAAIADTIAAEYRKGNEADHIFIRRQLKALQVWEELHLRRQLADELTEVHIDRARS